MNQKLAKSAQSVQDALAQKGLECTVVELSDSTRTAQDAAAAIGCDVAQIVKSLVFKTKLSHQPILILASGSNRVNEQVIESHLTEKMTKADADFVREITGFAIGGIPPIAHKQSAVFNLRGNDLFEMTQGKVIAIC